MITHPLEVTIVRPDFSLTDLLWKFMGSMLTWVLVAWCIMLLLPAIHPSLATISFTQVFVAYAITRWVLDNDNYQMWSKEP